MTASDPASRLRPLGATGLSVSPIGLGLAALGRPGYINLGRHADLGGQRSVEAMERRSHEVLDEAWRLGVRYFDAARSYGRAEAFLGSWLAARDEAHGDAVVGSKWGYTYTAGWTIDAERHEVKDLSFDTFRRQLPETRERLGDRLDLYQVHSLTLESGALDDGVLLAEMAALKAEGVRIGFSSSGPNQAATIARATAVTIDGVRLFDTVQATWNLLERSVEPALAEAHDAGLGVIVKEALANGRLTEHNADPSFATQRDRLARQARRLETTVDALALAAVLARPWVDVVLSGGVTREQLRSNVRAWDVAWDEAADDALDALIEPAERYWTQRSQLRWS